MEDKRKPKIRFKGFTDDWEQRKLGEVLSFLKDGTHGTHLDANSGPLLLSAKNIKNGHIKWDETDRRISKEEYDKIHSNFSLRNGDVLLTIVGSIGETAILRNVEGVTFQRSVAFLRPNNDITSEFLYAEIQTPNFQKELENRKSTSAQPGIYLGDLAKIPVKFSVSTDEQNIIGRFFTNIDKLISLHQRKLDDLKKQKKGLLQKMFPKKGEKVPEIRFPGFTNDWEQRKFGDVGSVSMCKRIFKEETSEEGDIPFYKIGTFGSEPDAFISRKLFEEYKCKFSYPNKGDILLSASGTIGRIVEYNGEEAYFQDSNIVWLVHDKTISNKFLKVLYPTVKWDGIEGSTIKRLYNDNFLKTKFMMPSLPEQEKIGAYFEQLDKLISLHQRQLDKLKKIKKSLLENMFV